MPEAAPVLVVTRPVHQAGALSGRLAQAGFKVLQYPVLDIVPRVDDPALQAVLSHLADFDLAIFISANAVENGLEAVAARGSWPASLHIAAIGEATARALREHQHSPQYIAPPPHNSEALLSLPALRAYRHAVIFRGVGGREQLAESLREMGLRVEYANCYQRQRPKGNDEELRQAWNAGQTLAFIVTSNQGLENLLEMTAPEFQSAIRQSMFVVVSERTRDLAIANGVKGPILLAAAAADDAIIDCLEHYRLQAQQA